MNPEAEQALDELKACPFCGSSNTTLDYYEISCPQELGTIVICNDCGASAKSIVDWNTRPIEDALTTRIAELEADNKKTFDLVRKLRMYCIWANWDNPDTEDEFNEFDVEVCKWLSKFMEREE